MLLEIKRLRWNAGQLLIRGAGHSCCSSAAPECSGGGRSPAMISPPGPVAGVQGRSGLSGGINASTTSDRHSRPSCRRMIARRMATSPFSRSNGCCSISVNAWPSRTRPSGHLPSPTLRLRLLASAGNLQRKSGVLCRCCRTRASDLGCKVPQRRRRRTRGGGRPLQT